MFRGLWQIRYWLYTEHHHGLVLGGAGIGVSADVIATVITLATHKAPGANTTHSTEVRCTSAIARSMSPRLGHWPHTPKTGR